MDSHLEMADALLCEATALDPASLPAVLEALSELGDVEWNDDLGQYELLSDGATRGQFKLWLRTQHAGFKADGIRDLFVRRGAADILANLGRLAEGRNWSTRPFPPL